MRSIRDYVFEGGTFTTDKTSFSCKTVVNEGTFVVNGLFNVNTSCEFYNGATAVLQAGEVEVTNKAKLYNDGKIESADFQLNTYAELHNCENGTVAIGRDLLRDQLFGDLPERCGPDG